MVIYRNLSVKWGMKSKDFIETSPCALLFKYVEWAARKPQHKTSEYLIIYTNFDEFGLTLELKLMSH